MTNTPCPDIRGLLQDACDRHAPPDAACTAHLAVCASCRAFHAFLSSHPARLRTAVDARLARRGAGDFTAVAARALAKEKHRRRRRAASFSGLAAAVMIGAGALFVSAFIERDRIERIVREENSRFIDDLFDEAASDGIEYLTLSR